ncbi:hypothetical protein [Nonomuraea longicatena]|uniref:Uncharacterized protein n=1 Tax=Nonomuraea longicatena TaxID=83682 RepID=A0ABN1NPW6_9ACTN
MDIYLLIVMIAVILAVVLTVLFAVLVTSIRREDSRRHLSDTGLSPTETLSRRLLGTYTHRAERRR